MPITGFGVWSFIKVGEIHTGKPRKRKGFGREVVSELGLDTEARKCGSSSLILLHVQRAQQ